jgi:hypothetical protein
MTDMSSHLTEDERHSVAEGSVPADCAPQLEAHLAHCADCWLDVARLRALMTRVHGRAEPEMVPDDLWLSIRSRIEQRKVVALAGDTAVAPRSHSGWRRPVIGLAVAASALAVVGSAVHARRADETRRTVVVYDVGNAGDVGDTGTRVMAIADSVRTYEQEAKVLLDQLELQRAMLRPDAVVSIDRGVKVIDGAIAELETAIANDPTNPALRQLLASSYRQKIDLLKRANNAG